MPLAGLIKKKLSEIQNSGLEIEMIAPSHGVIWKNPGRIIEAYSRWANFESENKVVIVFDTSCGISNLSQRAEASEQKGTCIWLIRLERQRLKRFRKCWKS